LSPLETDPFEWLRRAQADLRAAELLLADPVLPSLTDVQRFIGAKPG